MTTATDQAVGRDPASFRDPSGYVFWRDGQPHRRIERRFAAEWDAFAASAYAAALIERGMVLGWQAVEPTA